jgi:5-methylcytosine-specific restriction endonuclease McrA
MTFKNDKCFQQHLKSQRHIEKHPPHHPTFACDGCGKKYCHRQSLRNHKMSCTEVPVPVVVAPIELTTSIQELELKIEVMKQTFEKERQEMNEQINKIIEKKTKEHIHKFLEKEIKEQIHKILEKETEIKQKSCEKRKKISKDIRQQIAEKQENACGECKQILTPYFELDHIIGLQFGGTDDESNLMALCRECHGEKSVTENQCRKQIQDAIKTILREKKQATISH